MSRCQLCSRFILWTRRFLSQQKGWDVLCMEAPNSALLWGALKDEHTGCRRPQLVPDCRQTGSYPETGFEEVGRLVPGSLSAVSEAQHLTPSPSLAGASDTALRLLARNNFRVARHAGVIPSRRSIACAPIHYRC